jgi:adenosylcobinamide amidohydrolase
MPTTAPARDPLAPTLVDGERVLVVPLGGPHEVLSWAVVNGGRRRADTVVWRFVRLGELDLDVDADAVARAALAVAQRPEAPLLMTGRAVGRYVDLTVGGARCVVTAGMSNALAVGDPPGTMRAIGTINLLCRVAAPLREEAMIEACALAVEARTAAVLEAKIPSRGSDRLATGTGTDCIVIAAPVGAPGERWIGKHTALGADVGAVVHRATAQAIAEWWVDVATG